MKNANINYKIKCTDVKKLKNAPRPSKIKLMWYTKNQMSIINLMISFYGCDRPPALFKMPRRGFCVGVCAKSHQSRERTREMRAYTRHSIIVRDCKHSWSVLMLMIYMLQLLFLFSIIAIFDVALLMMLLLLMLVLLLLLLL